MMAVDVDVDWSDVRLYILYNYGQLIGRRLDIGCDIGLKISDFVFLGNYGQLIDRTTLIGLTLVDK